MSGVSVPSADEYEAQRASGTSDFSLFPSDDYVLEVQEINLQPNKVDIFHKPKEGEPQRTFLGLEVRFRPISFANGDELVDEDGNEIPSTRNPLFFDWFDTERVGLKPVPAKARKFFAFASGRELEDRIDIEDFQTLVGKRLIGTVIIKDKNGTKRNNITDYRLIRRRRGAGLSAAAPAASPEAAAAAKIAAPAEDLVAAAKEIFKDDMDDLPF